MMKGRVCWFMFFVFEGKRGKGEKEWEERSDFL